jgi:hypothetical protein
MSNQGCERGQGEQNPNTGEEEEDRCNRPRDSSIRTVMARPSALAYHGVALVRAEQTSGAPSDQIPSCMGSREDTRTATLVNKLYRRPAWPARTARQETEMKGGYKRKFVNSSEWKLIYGTSSSSTSQRYAKFEILGLGAELVAGSPANHPNWRPFMYPGHEPALDLAR